MSPAAAHWNLPVGARRGNEVVGGTADRALTGCLRCASVLPANEQASAAETPVPGGYADIRGIPDVAVSTGTCDLMSGTAGLIGHLAIGDNLHILREYVDDESIDLVYLDPPFNSNRAYSLIFKDPGRGHSEAQALAFKDQWIWNAGTEARFRDLLIPSVGSRATTRLSRLLANQVSAFERTQMAAYLVEMAVRLVELHRVLKLTGSLYLHCDPTASHYLKVVLDAVFGPQRFRSEVIWKRASAHSSSKRWSPVHDTLLFYSKGDTYTWNPVHQALPQSTMDAWYNNVEPGTGRRFNRADLTAAGVRAGPSGSPWRGVDPSSKGRHWAIPRFVKEVVSDLETQDALDALDAAGRLFWPKAASGIPMLKRYLEEARGVPPLDVITDINPLNNVTAERLGYPTQKPIALLTRIIEASSNPGDVVLDPFCGCGTTIDAAQALERSWIGIDISVRAVDVIKERFQAVYGEALLYRVLAPADEEAARRLAETKPHGRREFEAWALTLIGARKNVDHDRGVDGLIPFIGPRGRIQQALVSVKSGHTSPSEVRDLVGAVHRERSPAGIFLTLGEPTKEMKLEAARATPLIPGIPRIQIITIREALREDSPARPILPAYRQAELFDAIPEGTNDLALLEGELRDAIAQGRTAKAAARREWRARIIETMQRVLEEEPDYPVVVASREGQRSPRTSRRDPTAPLRSPESGRTDKRAADVRGPSS